MGRSVARCLVVAGLVVGSALAATTPAQAYSGLTHKAAYVDLDNCRSIGALPAVKVSGGCRLNDSADGTFFATDANATALKVEMYDSSGMVAKAEFHPKGEKLYYYDTRNDGDAVYFALCVGYVEEQNCHGPYAAPGTSAVVEYGVKNFSLAEGTRVSIGVYYDRGGQRRYAHVGYGFA